MRINHGKWKRLLPSNDFGLSVLDEELVVDGLEARAFQELHLGGSIEVNGVTKDKRERSQRIKVTSSNTKNKRSSGFEDWGLSYGHGERLSE